ncbi:MAG: hypothetical protein GX801_10760 [Fibrobacter sp.]|nr:hypothetical protein [Fibrobacter sp.]
MAWCNMIMFFIAVIFLRFLTNYYKYLRINKLFKGYNEYLETDGFEFNQNKKEIQSLFEQAGLKDSAVTHQEPLGGGVKYTKMSVFDNLTNTREDIVGVVSMRFHEAIGVYKKRYKESFNPIFWLDVIIKLPQHIMSFLGVLPEKHINKAILILYWIIVSFFGLKQIDLFH